MSLLSGTAQSSWCWNEAIPGNRELLRSWGCHCHPHDVLRSLCRSLGSVGTVGTVGTAAWGQGHREGMWDSRWALETL